MKMNDLKKKFLVSLGRIEYKHVKQSDEYIETQEKYRKLKKDLSRVESSIKGLMNYEHSGSAMKKINHGLSIIGSASRLNIGNPNDVFSYMSQVTNDFGNDDDAQVKNMAGNMTKAYTQISEEKIKFNEDCKKELELLTDIKKKITSIDKERENVKLYAYDLECSLQKEDREESERYKDLYNKSVSSALSKMNDFLGENGVQGILRRMYEYNLEFFKNSYKIMDELK